MLPYFKAAEDQQRGADEFHGARRAAAGVGYAASGSIVATPSSRRRPRAGIPKNPDFNGAAQEGAGWFQTTTRRGRRASTARSYLRPARRRSNLRVETAALAQRIVFEGRRAVAVEYKQGGMLKTARAGKEILVSSGAYNSPQLLQLSGVGPADLLKSHGIEVVLDAPGVGRDLQDHMQVRIVTRCTQRITLNDIVNSPLRKLMIGTAIRRLPHRAADHRGGHLGRVPENRSAAFDAGCADSLPPFLHRQDGRGAACLFRIFGLGLPAAPREPRVTSHQERRPGGGAGNPHQLSRHRDRPQRQCRRPEDPAQDSGGAGAETVRGRRGRARRRKSPATTNC